MNPGPLATEYAIGNPDVALAPSVPSASGACPYVTALTAGKEIVWLAWPTVTTWKSKNGAVTKTVFEAQASDELE